LGSYPGFGIPPCSWGRTRDSGFERQAARAILPVTPTYLPQSDRPQGDSIRDQPSVLPKHRTPPRLSSSCHLPNSELDSGPALHYLPRLMSSPSILFF
jgi:hypothetical protein